MPSADTGRIIEFDVFISFDDREELHRRTSMSLRMRSAWLKDSPSHAIERALRLLPESARMHVEKVTVDRV